MMALCFYHKRLQISISFRTHTESVLLTEVHVKESSILISAVNSTSFCTYCQCSALRRTWLPPCAFIAQIWLTAQFWQADGFDVEKHENTTLVTIYSGDDRILSSVTSLSDQEFVHSQIMCP